MLTENDLKRRLAKPRPGRAILFTGAGFSKGALNAVHSPIPLAREFAQSLAIAIGEPPDLPLTLAAEIYNEKKNDPSALLALLKGTFTAKEPTKDQRAVLSYPWKRIYTTNYDDVAEHVASPDGIRPDSFSRNTMPLTFEGTQRQIVHINGYVGELDRDSALDDFALTLSSYWDKTLFSSPWATTLRQDFELADLIVFIGYSLYDQDVSTILGKNPQLKEKTALIQANDVSQADERFLTRFGTLFKIGIDGFASLVDTVVKRGPVTVVVSGPENFTEVTLPISPPASRVTDRDVDALLGRGIFDRTLFFSSRIRGGREYLTNRRAATQVFEALKATNSHVVVHSELGNGKTLLLEQVAFLLLRENYRVFLLERRTDNFSFDVEFFSQLADPYVLFIEDLITNSDAIEVIRSQLSRARMVATSRSSAFEIKFSDVRHLFSTDVKVLDTNKLQDEDADSLVQILNAGAYWKGFPQANSNYDKRRVIERKCRSEMGSVILGIVESQVLDDRIRSILGRSADASSALILALCLAFVELRPTFELLSELLGKDIFSVMSSLKDDHVRDFFAISGIEVVARSPVLSAYLLKNFVSDDRLISVLITALEASSDRYKRAKRYRDINSRLLRFSFIEKIISSVNNKYDRVQDYYDRAGEVGYKNFSPYYWLQYAIAARSFKDYKSADRFFAESRRTASGIPTFNTYQIDNAYAQFLLESRKGANIWSDFYDAFVEASSLSLQQTYVRNAGLYPYRVASKFQEYLEVRGDKFTRKQKQEVADICKGWIARIDSLPAPIRKNKLVKEARTSVSDSYDFVTG